MPVPRYANGRAYEAWLRQVWVTYLDNKLDLREANEGTQWEYSSLDGHLSTPSFVTLDGNFTPDQLRLIADTMDKADSKIWAYMDEWAL